MTNFLLTKSKSKYFKNLGYLFLMLVFSAAVNAQTTVTGTVSDSSGPIPGVNIIVKGTKNSAVTDFDGGYSLKGVPANGVLVFSFVGFKTKEIAVSDRTKIDVVLQENANDLKEVVVVGYGTMKRGDLTGSVSSVSSKSIAQTVTTSIEQVLQGRAAGVQVSQNSGAPGAASSIRIRGISSINASNEPIYVIDGVIIDGQSSNTNFNPISSINPSDIVSIDILKDASATAIYGSRASGGVIMVTTKRGKKGELTLSLDSYIGWQEIPKHLDVLNLKEYGVHKNTRSDLGIVERDPYFIRTDLLGEGTDWQDELFAKALVQSYNLSASGGSEKSTYYMGIGYLNQDGIAVGSGFDRLNLSSNLDSQVKDYFKVGLNFALNNSKQTTTVSDQSLILTALKQTPNVAVRNADGSFDGPDTDQFVQNNPIGLANINDNHNENVGIRASTFGEITFTKGLTFKTQYSLNYGFTNDYTFNPSYTFGQIKNETRTGSRTKGFSKFWSWNNVLNYNRTFGKHTINAMLGQEAQESYWENLYGSISGYLTNTSTDLSMGDPKTAIVSNNSNGSSLNSYFGRAFYSFDDKYLLTATMRRDGSSKFAEGNRWGWFPSAAFAWKVSNENFLKDNKIISNLKLRLGWGAVGNQNVPNYAYTSTYRSSATANWGTGLLASNTANKDLKWETTYSSNIGIDLGLFDNRIELVADVYYKKTDDLLNQLALPAYVGTSGQGSTSPPWYNIGSLENKGIEIALNTINFQRDEFKWTSNFVFSMNKNKVLSLNSDSGHYDQTIQQGSDVTVVTRTAVGNPISQFYGYKVIGRFEKATDFYYKDAAGNVVPTALPKDMKISENGAWIGDYIFEDSNKDGVIDDKDLQYIGNPLPQFTFGIGNTFTYKGFDINIFLDGSYGNDVVNYQRRFLENPRENTNLFSTALGYAQLELIDPTGPNDYRNVQIVGGDPYMPRIAASSASSASNFRFSNRFVEDGSFVRIKNISIGYNLPSSFVSKIGVAGIKLYTNMQNIITFTKYSGYDPEVGSLNQNALITGVDNGRYPTPRFTTFGVNVKF
ncbi:SusC/RagA family TonB-linked outer membrane protein [Flavobacterium sp. HJJ]|uniref:SusC/RagA family TonB-linked outer membrane protein n=1 Tax=Flavobacterium sp. HJJ TaxID=2783792 RepID=UPI00188B4441|nr:TonB-dependent receptor [Flavobacterium sp. HJJ]MBF4470460.1 TonB-dependent receptor [Flavobacterium sp. HJJ]